MHWAGFKLDGKYWKLQKCENVHFEALKSTENALKWPQNDAETRYMRWSIKASEYNGMRQKASGEPSVSGKIQAALWSAEEIFWDAA